MNIRPDQTPNELTKGVMVTLTAMTLFLVWVSVIQP